MGLVVPRVTVRRAMATLSDEGELIEEGGRLGLGRRDHICLSAWQYSEDHHHLPG